MGRETRGADPVVHSLPAVLAVPSGAGVDDATLGVRSIEVCGEARPAEEYSLEASQAARTSKCGACMRATPGIQLLEGGICVAGRQRRPLPSARIFQCASCVLTSS